MDDLITSQFSCQTQPPSGLPTLKVLLWVSQMLLSIPDLTAKSDILKVLPESQNLLTQPVIATTAVCRTVNLICA